jgi:hypothetical protein
MLLRIAPVAAILVVGGVVGCTSVRLGQRTIHQASTLPDLEYQQVLNNLARFATNPSSLPWHVNMREGTTQITDSVSGGAAVDLGPPTETLPQLFGSRTLVVQWGTAPVINPIELRLLRIAYRRALGFDEMPDPELRAELAHELKNQFFPDADQRNESELFYEYASRSYPAYAQFDAHVTTTNDEDVCVMPEGPQGAVSPLARDVCRQVNLVDRQLARIQPGWFHIGRKRDVPKHTCYVGRYCGRYVWVEPEGEEALTQFTLTVMKISTLIKELHAAPATGQVRFSPGDRPG